MKLKRLNSVVNITLTYGTPPFGGPSTDLRGKSLMSQYGQDMAIAIQIRVSGT